MHVGRAYRLRDFALWSRRSLVYMLLVSVLAVLAYTLPPFAGFSIPWPIIVVLGTTVSLVAGFKNSQVLTRSSDALAAFAQIAASSRMLAAICCEFVDRDVARTLIYRHLAWLTALRFSLRRPMLWESMSLKANREFRRRYHIHEDQPTMAAELTALLGDEAATATAHDRPELNLLYLQGRQFGALFKDGTVQSAVYGEFMKVLRDCEDQQARCDRIKNNPYPRQYAIVSAMFVAIFCTLLPFGTVSIFAALAPAGSVLQTVAIWLSIPFTALLGWMYMALDQVGESTSNPFEGNANDVPITQICRDLEIELRGWLGETDLPPRIEPVNGIAT